MEAYLKLAQEIATESAEIALKYFGFDTETTWKSDNSPLTVADTTINKLVIEKVQKAFPTHSVYGEEERIDTPGSEYIWVCDPIDGTMPFSCGIPTFTLSLALVDQKTGLPILGLINDPVLKNMYWATKGGGAFRNGKKISVNKNTELKGSYVELDGSEYRLGFESNFSYIKLREKQVRVMKLLSLVYGAVQVPNGKFIGAIFFGQFGHDIAALKIITEEAGGKVTDLLGNERRYDTEGLGCIISNGLVHEELLECVKKL